MKCIFCESSVNDRLNAAYATKCHVCNTAWPELTATLHA
jgi:hypothetical protein